MSDQVQTITIPGVGDVDFPSEMSHGDIGAAIEKNFPAIGQLRQTAQRNASARMQNFLTPQASGPQTDVNDVFHGNHPYATRETDLESATSHPNPVGPITPPAWTQKSILSALSPLRLSSAIRGKDMEQDARGMLKENQPVPGTMQRGDSTPTKIAKGVARAGVSAAEGLTTPSSLGVLGGIAAAPEAAAPLLDAVFTGQAFKGSKEELQAAREAQARGDIGAASEHYTASGINAVFGSLATMHGMHAPEVATPTASEPTPSTPTEQPLQPSKTPETPVQPPIVQAEKPQTRPTATAEAPKVTPVEPKPPVQATPETVDAEPRQPKVVDTPKSQTPETEEQPQAKIPSSSPDVAKLEAPMRKLAGSVIGLQRLSEAAQHRLNVEVALRQIKGGEVDQSGTNAEELVGNKENQNPLADPTRNFGELNPSEQTVVKSVAKTLGVPVDSLRSNGWRLTDAQVDDLKTERKLGLKPFSIKALDPTHPETAFNDYVHHQLADINVANAKIAGLPNAKNLWDRLTPKEKQLREERKAQQEATKSGLVSSNLSPEEQVIQQQTLGKLAQAVGMSTKDFVASGFKFTGEQRAKLQAAAKADPSLTKALVDLAQAQHEKATKAGTTSAGLEVAGQHQAEDTGIVSKGGKSIDDLQFEHDMMQNVVRRSLKQAQSALNERIPAWREARKGETAPSKLATDLAKLEPKSLRGIPKELYADEHITPRTEQAGEAASKQEPVQAAEAPGKTTVTEASKADVNEKPKGDVTMYSNPIVPLLKEFFGFKKPSNVASMTAGVSPRETPIHQLTELMEGHNSTPGSVEQSRAFFDNEARKVQEMVADAPRITKNLLDTIGDAAKTAWNAYATRGGLDALQWALGRRRLQLTQNAMIMREFTTRIMKEHPSSARREAMVNYLQASGGVMDDTQVNGMLQLKANEFENTSVSRENKRLKQGYLDAQNLTDKEKQTIAEYRVYDKMLSKQEADEGMSIQAHENYIRQVWSHDSLAQKAIDAIASASPFSISGSFTKMRHFEDYFEGEMSGFTPKNKDLGYLAATRARASAEVLANRTLVKELYNETMPDGSPLAMPQGTGFAQEPNPTDEASKGALLVKSNRPADAVTPDGRAYVAINHGSFQNWTWVGQSPDGTQVLYKGNMLVHPDVAKQLNRVLGPSAVRETGLGRVALKTSSVGKQTLLIGLFHPVQLGVHFLEHAAEGGTSGRTMAALNPLSNKPVIDLTDQTQQLLVVHGLKVADFNAEATFDEGLMSRGFASGMPVVGAFWRNLHDAMFTKYIPNIKMGMALDALDRNMSRYHDRFMKEEIANAGGSVTPQERILASKQAQSRIYRMTSEQMNAAFGGINWDALPVNKTFQDVARLTVLAPDFLLARMQFAGDAFRPGGWESRKALLIGAFVQYAGARAFNSAMNDGDPKWDIHDWNKFVVGRNEYSLRTVQGDMTDAALDTRRFVEHRLNPLTMRPALEAGLFPGQTGPKDIYGHPLVGWQGAGQFMLDFAKNIVPIPAQGLVDALAGKKTKLRGPQDDDRIVDTILSSMTGVRRSKYRTPAERIIYQHFDNLHPPTSPDDPLSLEQKNTFNRMLDLYQQGKLTDDDLDKAVEDPKANLKTSQIRYIYRVANETRFARNARQLPFMDLMDAWPKAKPAEKLQLAPLLQRKLKTLAPSEQDKYQNMLDSYRDGLSDEESQKISEEIQKDIDYENPPTAEEAEGGNE